MESKLSRWLKMEIPGLGKRKPRRKPSLWERRIQKGMGILFLLTLICFAIWRIHLYCEINHRLKQIQAAGLPVTGQELNLWRQPVPDGENAALVLTQAFALLRSLPGPNSNRVSAPALLDRRVQWSVETQKMVSAYVTINAEAMAMARAAVQRERCRYEADFSHGIETKLPHLGNLRSLSRVITLHSIAAGEGARANQWPEDIKLTLKLAATLDEEPILISHMTRGLILRMAAETTECNLNTKGVKEDMCEQLQEAFARAERTNLLPFALIGERAMLIPMFRLCSSQMQSVGHTDDESSQSRKSERYSGEANRFSFLWLTGFFERDLSFFLQSMETDISLAALPAPASLSFTNASEQFRETANRNYYMFSGILLPSLSHILISEAITVASLRLTRTALAVERFRLAHERLPEDLNELTPKFLPSVPQDPFDGKALRYRRLEKGYVLYSIGRDGHDDAGREKPIVSKSNDTASYDLAFVVER